jgi:hypothetical protein
MSLKVDSTTLFCDNQSDVRLVFNPEFHKRTNNHIDVQHNFIRDKHIDRFLHTTCLQKKSSRNILLRSIPVHVLKNCAGKLVLKIYQLNVISSLLF